MFDNIGEKIKTLATVSCWVGIAASFLGSIVLLIEGELLNALLTAVSGPLASWVGSFVLYGFGDLIDTNRMILSKLESGEKGSSLLPKSRILYSENKSEEAAVEKIAEGHQWRCDNCGNMISKDICPFCGKAYGPAAEKIESLNRLRKNGTITPAEYEKRVEKLRFE